jgi:hypothetical protein
MVLCTDSLRLDWYMRFFLRWVVPLWVLSIAAMVAIDYLLGPRAEFLNAFNAFQHLLGYTPSPPPSLVASKLGPWSELLAVLAANLLVGLVLGPILRLGAEHLIKNRDS